MLVLLKTDNIRLTFEAPELDDKIIHNNTAAAAVRPLKFMVQIEVDQDQYFIRKRGEDYGHYAIRHRETVGGSASVRWVAWLPATTIDAAAATALNDINLSSIYTRM